MKLTEEQRQTVSDNHNLIYWYINMKNLDADEWYDLLAIELCYAVAKHDSSRGALSNYFKLRADGMVAKEYRKSQAKKRIPSTLEFNEDLYTVECDLDIEKEFELREWMQGEHSEIIKMRLEGYNQSEIADVLGVSQSHISRTLIKLREEYDDRQNDC